MTVWRRYDRAQRSEMTQLRTQMTGFRGDTTIRKSEMTRVAAEMTGLRGHRWQYDLEVRDETSEIGDH